MARRQKSFEERRAELAGALDIIANAIQNCEQGGGISPLRTVAVQLRALIVAKGSNHPLLTDLAEERSFPLIVFTGDPEYFNKISKTGGKAPIFYSTGDPLSLTRDEIYCTELSLQDAMSQLHVVLQDQKLSLSSVILLVADTEAAHYDPTRPLELDGMSQVQLGGLPTQYRTIYSIGRVVIELGRRFLQATS